MDAALGKQTTLSQSKWKQWAFCGGEWNWGLYRSTGMRKEDFSQVFCFIIRTTGHISHSMQTSTSHSCWPRWIHYLLNNNHLPIMTYIVGRMVIEQLTEQLNTSSFLLQPMKQENKFLLEVVEWNFGVADTCFEISVKYWIRWIDLFYIPSSPLECDHSVYDVNNKWTTGTYYGAFTYHI